MRISVHRSLLSSFAVASVLCAPAVVQAKALDFDVPAQDAASGVKELARQAGIQFILTKGDAVRRQTNAVKGSLETRAALDALLKGTGLEVRSFDGKVAVIAAISTADVIVTGTRVVRDGYEAPTPVTVLGGEEIERKASTSISDQLAQLPALAGSANPRSMASNISGGISGIATLNLRGLGAERTLIMLDGQRLPASAFNGWVDTKTLPSALVKRVDIVTGGASAAWGSDAVAGVVNFVLDRDFTGVKGQIQGGVTTYGDDRNYKLALTAGTDFADGRGHFLVSGETWYSEGIEGMPRNWYRGRKTLVNPDYTADNGEPYYLVRDNVGYTTVAPGAIVTNGPLRGLYFGEGGATAQLHYGDIVSDPFMVGGDWRTTDFGNGPQDLDPELAHHNVFSRLSYEVSDNIELFGEFSYVRARSSTTGTPMFNFGGLIIQRDNAFLPVEVGEAMDDANVTSLNVGSLNDAIGSILAETRRELYRYALGVNGTFDAFGSQWDWTLRGTHNVSKFRNSTYIPIKANYAKAIDAVYHNGAIVCRSTLSDSSDGCQPLNILGTGIASQPALDYVMGTSWLNATIKQDVVSATLHGEPFSTWVGPVSLAMGAEYRREEENGDSDELSLTNSYWAGNYKPITGDYSVSEAFLEAVVPLAADAPFAKTLDLNGAVRATDYSTSGYVTTWKLGATWAPVEDIRFRVTRSRDIRAAGLGEMFQAGQTNTTTLVDPFKNDQAYTVFQTTVGNPEVAPEKADTWNIGAVFQPRFIPGFSASVDYFDINVKDAIGTLGASTIVDQCFQGNQTTCALIERDADGFMTEVFRRPINMARYTARGLDFEASYLLPLADLGASWGDGSIKLRFLATRYLESSYDNGITEPTVNLGENTGIPTWRYQGEIVLEKGPVTVSFTGRGFSDGVIANSFVECSSNCPTSTSAHRTIDNNHVDGAFYFDATASYEVSENATVYFAVDNLLNRAPAPYGSAGTGIGSAQIGVSQLYYDVIGRSFRAGLRFKL